MIVQRLDLSPKQSAVLAYLRKNPGCTITEIAASVATTTRSVMVALATISAKGYTIHAARECRQGAPTHYTVID